MNKQHLIDEILDLELAMFLAVKTDQPAPCREDPAAFKKNRSAQFQTWSVETLASYRNDLETAAREERNLMTLKYARMENLIPPLNTNSVIGEIVRVNVLWQKEMAGKYPNLISRGRPIDAGNDSRVTSFQTYLASELETYSDVTLASLFNDIQEFQERNENMMEKVYEHLVKGLGYRSIQEAEEAAGKRG
ncbi:MAG: DUF4125 family protein [Desulfobacterales bacterium]